MVLSCEDGVRLAVLRVRLGQTLRVGRWSGRRARASCGLAGVIRAPEGVAVEVAETEEQVRQVGGLGFDAEAQAEGLLHGVRVAACSCAYHACRPLLPGVGLVGSREGGLGLARQMERVALESPDREEQARAPGVVFFKRSEAREHSAGGCPHRVALMKREQLVEDRGARRSARSRELVRCGRVLVIAPLAVRVAESEQEGHALLGIVGEPKQRTIAPTSSAP